MNAEKAVRIIVKNNEQVGKIIKWYQDNKQTLDAEKFVIPFSLAVLYYREKSLALKQSNMG